ncbi:MAG: methyltransferase domain-containing protein [Deltaproteobacteria bacterium]|nr:methyltransferase domain-containing protein [Deltaproteobacteria bacterium]
MEDAKHTVSWNDGSAYERFMGQWSRVAGRVFLDWLALPKGLKWLDVGCGTGAFTETIQQNCAAAEIIAVDPAAAHVEYGQSRHTATGAQFQVVDARSMPFENGRFDAAVSALVLNFIPDREKAVAEMRRVVRPGGTVAAYVWDFAGRNGTAQHLNAALRQLDSVDTSGALNAESTSQDKLKDLFQSAGLADVEARPIEITVTFRDLDDYWESNTGFSSPASNSVKALTDDKREELKQMVKSKLPMDKNGVISYMARVNAVRGRV